MPWPFWTGCPDAYVPGQWPGGFSNWTCCGNPGISLELARLLGVIGGLPARVEGQL